MFSNNILSKLCLEIAVSHKNSFQSLKNTTLSGIISAVHEEGKLFGTADCQEDIQEEQEQDSTVQTQVVTSLRYDTFLVVF